MSATTVTIYSLPACVQCNATYRTMDKKGLTYEVQDAAEPGNNEMLKELGCMQAPGVVVRQDGVITDHWSGFQPARIDELAVSLAGSEALIPA